MLVNSDYNLEICAALDIAECSVQLTNTHGQLELEFLLANEKDVLGEFQQDTSCTLQRRSHNMDGSGHYVLHCTSKICMHVYNTQIDD